MHEFLRRRLVSAAAVGALLRHCDTNPWAFFPEGIGLVDPPSLWFKCTLSKALSFYKLVSSGPRRRNKFPARRSHFSLWRRTPETPHGYQVRNNTGGPRRQRHPETVKCEPSASSLPLPSCWLARR